MDVCVAFLQQPLENKIQRLARLFIIMIFTSEALSLQNFLLIAFHSGAVQHELELVEFSGMMRITEE